MGELHTEPIHPLGGADHESYFDLHVAPPGYQPKGEGDSGYLAQYGMAYSGRMGLIRLGQLPTCLRDSSALVGNSPLEKETLNSRP